MWSGLRREVWQEGWDFFSFLIPDSKFHAYDYFSTSWKLASAFLDLAFVATVSPRCFLAVRACPASIRDI